MGITEADATFDIDGWDSAVKTVALANVLMNARLSPLDVDRRGIARLTPEKMSELARKGKTVRLVSRAHSAAGRIRLRVRAEVLEETDVLATPSGTSNLVLLDTDLMGRLGVLSISPGVEQTAYGLFSDLVDITQQTQCGVRASAETGGNRRFDPGSPAEPAAESLPPQSPAPDPARPPRAD